MSGIYSFWGRFPAAYNLACKPTFMFREEELRRRVVEKLELKEGETVLDLCCGTGANFPYLIKKVKRKGEVIGLDYSGEMLVGARKRRNRESWWNIYLQQGDACRLAEEEKFDGILCVLGLSAVPDYEKAIEKAVRALKKGRKMAVLEAKLFNGELAVFNPLLRMVYRLGADWKPDRDIRGELEKRLTEIKYEEYNKGTMYIVSGRRS